ncbi:MAG: PspA/IM30 family protein [Pseudomonadales bacterium]
MALLTRFSRLLSADLHAVLDRLEDPQVLLQQAQREMAAALSDQQHQLNALEQSLVALERNELSSASRLQALTAELDLCMDNDNEALARSVIKRRLQLQALQEQQRQDLQLGREQQRTLSAAIERQQGDLETITAEAEHLALRAHTDPATARATTACATPSVTDEAIELALLAERRARGSAV